MEIISNIINELMDTDRPISSPLLKTKVLASRIGNKNLLNWINGELNGYGNTELPVYRKSNGVLKGTYLNGNIQYKKASIPTAHLDKTTIDSLTAIEFKDSIYSVEDLTKKAGLAISVNGTAKAFLENSIQNNGNRYFQIVSIHIEIPANLLLDIISNVRSKLLDFMLEVENRFGQETELIDLKTNQSIINNIMNTTINTNGDGNLITNGNNNSITSSFSVVKGDKESLRAYLNNNKLDHDSIEELIILVDKEMPKDNKFGKHITDWIGKMINRAFDGSWEVSVGAAGGILATALQKYFGI